jgi:8-oxo-dGTP pyrophosphatase MutT (NUDIX family)
MEGAFRAVHRLVAKCAAVLVDMKWTTLDEALAAHPCADAKEARDVALIREFLRRHPEDAHLRTQQEGHLTGSGFVLDSSRTKLLLLHHAKLDRWLQPGGHGEGETDPRLVALREVEEETGLTALTPWPDERILDVDVHAIPARRSDPAHLHLDLRYGFVAAPGAEARLSEESRALRWFALDALPADADASLRRAARKLGGTLPAG